MSEKLVLIDGHSILNRAFFGIPDLSNSEGVHTNAVYGFLNILFKILDEEKPEYLTVAFDVNAPTFRHKMYEQYKGTRKPMAQELREQVPLMKEMLKAMGVVTIEKAGYEADDLLGTLAKRAEGQGLEVSIVSGDRDLLQLATEHIKIRIPKTKKSGTEVEDYNTEQVVEKYHVTPMEFIDVKALMGDTSDNVPGVPGIGEKTATKLISQYGSIENAYAHIDEMPKTKMRESLRENYEQAQFSKKLVTIDVHAEIEYNLDGAKLKNLYTPEAYLLCKRLEFKNMLSRFQGQAEPQLSHASDGFIQVVDMGQAGDVFAKLLGKEGQSRLPKASLQLIADADTVFGIAAALSENEVYFLKAGPELTPEYLVGKAASVLTSQTRVAMFGLKQALKFMDIPAQQQLFDVEIAAYLLNPLKNEYHYADVAKDYLGEMLPSREDLLGKLVYADAARQKPEQFFQVACYQAYTAFLVMDILTQRLDASGMGKLFETIEMPLVYTLSDMEKEGIGVQADQLSAYGQQLLGRIEELEQQIYEGAGEKFNINSPKQLGVILFEKLKMPYGKKTKTGYSTAADVLDKLAPEYPLVAQILEYRQLAKLKSTYADGLATCISADGRIHTTFHQTITATGRLSSTEPNLQNIPIRMELGRLIRKVFVPREGWVFIDADYSQIELRVLAHMSGDENLIQAYREAQDIHRMTASQVFHVPFEEVTALQRRNAKAVNFGIVYGISSFGLSQDLSITKKEAQEYIEQYFLTYPGIKAFLDQMVASAKETGAAVSMFGRVRPVPELKSSNFMQRSFGERVAMNSPIQGTAADIIKIAMNRVHDRLLAEGKSARLILQVHDELLVEAPKEEVSQVSQIIKEEMEHAADLSVALEVDMHTGTDWYEAK